MKLSSFLLIIGGIMNSALGGYSLFSCLLEGINELSPGILLILFFFLIGIVYILAPKFATKEVITATLIVALLHSFSMLWVMAQSFNAFTFYLFTAAILSFIGALLEFGRKH